VSIALPPKYQVVMPIITGIFKKYRIIFARALLALKNFVADIKMQVA